MVTNKYKSDSSMYAKSFFQTISETNIDKCNFKTISPKTLLAVKGDKIKQCYFILSGIINVLNQFENGKDFVYTQILKGSIVGEMEIIAGEEYFISTLECITPCEVIVFSTEAYFQWFQESFEFAKQASIRLSKMLCISARNNGRATAYSASENIALLLIQEYYLHNINGRVRLDDTRTNIAKRTGFSIRTVHRVIKSFLEKEFISLENGKIVIDDKSFHRINGYIDNFIYN